MVEAPIRVRVYTILGRSRIGSGVHLAILLTLLSAPTAAQTVEIAPFAGYRFGNDVFELAADNPVDLDGAPVVGATFNIDLGEGLSVEGTFTHQQAGVLAARGSTRVVVDHWLAGGRQEFGTGRARPFLSGLLGLTRYGWAGNDEVRFVVSCAGGVKMTPDRRLGLRVDGRVFTTFVDADARASACGPGICRVRVHVQAVWQIEFTAGLVVAF
jgi:hypothetical protein